jgi:PAS domain S-box-containing protein
MSNRPGYHHTGVTEALCKTTGFSEEELMGKSLHVLGASPVGGKTRLSKLLDTVAQGRTWQGEAKLSRKNGTEIWTDVIISPSRRKNDTVGYSIIYQGRLIWKI